QRGRGRGGGTGEQRTSCQFGHGVLPWIVLSLKPSSRMIPQRPLQWGKNSGAATMRVRRVPPRSRPLLSEAWRMIANHFSCTTRVAHPPHPGEDGTVFVYPRALASDSG